jgi:membrane peptidoglycan carboxypeptidase
MYVKGKDGTGNLDGVGGLSDFYGGAYPARTWTTFMEKALKGKECEEFPEVDYVNGSPTPTYTPSPTPTESPSPSPSPTEEFTPPGQAKQTPTPTPSPTPTESPTPTPSPILPPPEESTPPPGQETDGPGNGN